MHIVHYITRLIVGGAQENTLLTVEDQQTLYGDRVTLITGPGLGPEGSLEPRARAGGIDLRILGRAAAARLKLPCVHTIHGASFHTGQSALAHAVYQWLERRAAPATDRYISVCDAMTDQYVQAGIAPREKFVTISSGFDVEPFLNPVRPPQSVRAELGLAPEDIVIGKVARLFPLKGHEYLVQAAREVLERCPNVRFLLVGDGILRPGFEAELTAAGIRDRFVFTGLVPPGQVAELIHAMDIVVHTSVWEGLARVLPQGLIAGKPVVSYDIDGAREVVLPGETGFLLPPRSIPPLVDALVQLARDPQLRSRLGERGRALFTDPFRHQTMTRRIREVYADVLEHARRDA